MKPSLKLHKLKKTPTGIQFVRVFSYYVDLQLTGKKSQPFFFDVIVKSQAAFKQQTGMTVDLLKLDTIAKKVFKNQKLKCSAFQEFLNVKYQTLKEALKIFGIRLRSVQFTECRGLSVLIKNRTWHTFRHDYAVDDKGVLYFVSSQFDEKNRLAQIKIKNLKLNIEEQIIF